MIKKGAPVEFMRNRVSNFSPGDGEVGIAAEDSLADGSVKVELADGSFYQAKHIYAHSWGGWLPEDLEEIYERYNTNEY